MDGQRTQQGVGTCECLPADARAASQVLGDAVEGGDEAGLKGWGKGKARGKDREKEGRAE